MMEEMDLKELLHLILRKWWVLAVCAIVISAAVGFWSYYNTIPVYQANTTLYIGKNVEQSEQVAASDLNLATQLIEDYREIAKSRLVASAVISELGLKYMTTDQMAGRINVNPINGTRVIQISVSDTNPKMAMDITNKAAEVFQKKVMGIMKIENVQIIDKAELPRFPIPSNDKRNVVIAFVFGLAVGTGIVFLINLFDNTVKTPDDVKKYADLPVIGTIPVFPK